MKMEPLVIRLPRPLKAKLDALRSQGYTAAGFIRHLVERELQAKPPPRRKRHR